MARGCKNEFLEAAQIKLVTEIVCTFCNISQIFPGFCIFLQNFTGMQLCSHASVQAYRHAGTQAYKHAGMQPYKHAGLTPHLTCTSNPQFQISNHKPQAPNLKPKPQAEQKNQQNISKKLQKTIVKSGQKMSKIHKNHKKTQKFKTRNKNKKIISKSNTQQKQKQNKYNFKQNIRKSKNHQKNKITP